MKKTLLGLFLTFAAFPVYGGQMPTTQRGMSSLWHFNDGLGAATVKDSSGSATGTLGNGAAITLNGKFGGAVDFDGLNDFLSIGSAKYQVQIPLTIHAWIRPTVAAPVDDFGVVLGAAGIRMGLFYNSALQLGFRYCCGGAIQSLSPNNTIRLNSWQFVAVTIDSAGNLFLIRNDKVVKTDTGVGGISYVAGTTGIGSPDGIDYIFGGQIDDVAFYDSTALSTATLHNIYLGGVNAHQDHGDE